MTEQTERERVEADQYFSLLWRHFAYRRPELEAKLIALERGDHLEGKSDER